MQVHISPGKVSGSIVAPASKSMMQRACAGALLHKGKTTIHNAGHSEDDMAALSIIQKLGATVREIDATTIEIISNGVEPSALSIHCGESGLAARLFTPIASLSKTPILIEGSGSLLKRPMELFADILPQLEVGLSDFEGHIPFTVSGPLQAKSLKVDGSVSSQFLSGLLFALSYCTEEAITIDVSQLKSKPYVDMTLEILEHFGKPIPHDNYHRFYIDPATFQKKDDVIISIEADWSSAAYWLVAGAINGEINLKGLNLESKQADKAILEVLKNANAQITAGEGGVQVRSSVLRSFEFDATDCPDLFPVLAILASACRGESSIIGMHRLFHKESNRAESICEMLQQLEVPFAIEDDALCVTGVQRLEGGVVDAYNDHRITMAAAIASVHSRRPIIINGCESVKKSYPDFFKDLNLLGIGCNFKDQ